MHIRPAAGLKVRHPTTRAHIPETGLEVRPDDPHISYWVRRVRSGDVVEVAQVPAMADEKKGSSES